MKTFIRPRLIETSMIIFNRKIKTNNGKFQQVYQKSNKIL